MKKKKHSSLNSLYLLFNLIVFPLASFGYTSNEEITVVRHMPSFAEAGETITIEINVDAGDGITNPINGFYHFQIRFTDFSTIVTQIKDTKTPYTNIFSPTVF